MRSAVLMLGLVALALPEVQAAPAADVNEVKVRLSGLN